ncbi:MAG TPA: DUF2314 domain-containing protein [Planctomycetota bacterium]
MVVKRVLGVLAIVAAVALAVWLFPRRGIFSFTAPVVLVLIGWTFLRDPGKGIDQITPPDLKCPELEESVKLARATLGAFLPHVEKGGDGAFVKFPLKTPGGNLEHIWGYVHFYKDGRFNVSLANVPYDAKESPDGRRDVPREDVEDWQIVRPDGRIKGAHSLIALFRYHEGRGVKLTPKMKAQKASLLDAG